MYYYKQVVDGEIISVEAKSIDSCSPDFVSATKAEYDTFMASLPEPEPLEPPLSTHVSTLVSIDVGRARPAKVKRIWEGRDYFYDCFITENIKDQYVAGDIKIGDHLLVHFEAGEQIITAKVFKSWA